MRESPLDFDVASGRPHPISDLIELALAAAASDDPRRDLGWSPTTMFAEFVPEMVAIGQ